MKPTICKAYYLKCFRTCKYNLKTDHDRYTVWVPSGLLGSCHAFPKKILGLGPGSFLKSAKARYFPISVITKNTMLAKRAEAATEKMMIIALQLFLKNHESRISLAILKRFRFAWLSRSLCPLSILRQLKLLFRFRTVFHVVYSLRISCQIVKNERLV